MFYLIMNHQSNRCCNKIIQKQKYAKSIYKFRTFYYSCNLIVNTRTVNNAGHRSMSRLFCKVI